jgi:hypothetical protein
MASPSICEEKKKRSYESIVAIAVIALVLGVIGGMMTGHAGGSSRASNVMQFDVRWGLEALSLTNTGSSKAEGKMMTILLNGMPPFCYKAEWRAPKVGETARIPLNVFVKQTRRFDPHTQAVTEVWIGGAGYDFVQYH